MLSILVCDDLPEARASLVRLLRAYEWEHDVEIRIRTARSGAELLSLWSPGKWDAVFLDIYMPEMDGITAAHEIRRREKDSWCEIIFATTSWNHGAASASLRALDYLTKPILREDVERALNLLMKKHREELREISVSSVEREDVSLRLSGIRYIESRDKASVIHTAREDVTVRRRVDELSAEIGENGFLRCHQSYLVNAAHVLGLEKNALRLDTGEMIPVSARNRSAVRQALAGRLFGREKAYGYG